MTLFFVAFRNISAASSLIALFITNDCTFKRRCCQRSQISWLNHTRSSQSHGLLKDTPKLPDIGSSRQSGSIAGSGSIDLDQDGLGT